MRFLRTWLEPRMLAVALLAVAVAGFIVLAHAVVEGDTLAMDRAIMLALHPESSGGGPMWLQAMMRDATALGSALGLSLVVFLAVLFLLLSRRASMAVFILASTLGGILLSTLLKGAFSRPRPDVIPHGDFVTSASFPSGHSMMSAVVYLTLGILLVHLVDTRAQKYYIVVAAFFLSGIVGLSRVYLGVHWPTDVMAGWLVGAAWALGWWIVAEQVWGKSR